MLNFYSVCKQLHHWLNQDIVKLLKKLLEDLHLIDYLSFAWFINKT